jgi:transposase
MPNKSSAVALVLRHAVVLGGAVLFTMSASSGRGQAPANQQSQSSLDQQIDLLRRDLRSQRKQIIAQNMTLTDSEAVKFWPIYDQYVADLVASNKAKYELIKEYAQVNTMTEERADNAAKQWLTVDENVIQLRRKYLPVFRGVLSAKQTARFFQIDRRVQIMIDLQLASSLPLIEP